MIKEAIYHRPKNNFSYAYNEQWVHIRLQTKKNDVKQVVIHSKDPFEWGNMNQTSMKKMGSNEWYDFWQGEIKPTNRRLEYLFEVKDESETWFYTEKGFFSSLEHSKNPFKFPFLNKIDVFTAPDWVKDTVWYQIFPERFCNGNEKRNPVDTKSWGKEEPTWDNFFGGDLEGVIKQLDYLKELGITGIYFTPLFKAKSNHKYDTIDYFEIDPQFGDKETLRTVVKEAHKRGIRVMLDAVFNHCGYYFQPFQDVLEKGEQSIYKDWFHIHKFPVKRNPVPSYDMFAFTGDMPKLNTENEDVKNYLLSVARYWIEECNIDGWRLDVANEVDHVFWREFRREVKKIKPDCYILGEVWNDAMPWLSGDQFDAVMNYPLAQCIMDYAAYGHLSISGFRNEVEELLFKYPKNAHEVSFNLLGSHDTARILHACGENKEKVKLLFLLQLTLSGSPCIYYGDEIGMTGGGDPACRKCMIWEEEKQDRELFTFVKNLIALRKTYDSLSQGELVFHGREDVLAFEKRKNDETIFVAMNATNQPKKIEFIHSHLTVLHGNGKSTDGKEINLPPYGYMMFKK